jgi:hypothetical protein
MHRHRLFGLLFFTAALLLSGNAQTWEATTKDDPLTGKPYTLYVLKGKFLTPPAKGADEEPYVLLRCDPSGRTHLNIPGKLIAGFIVVNTVLDLRNGDRSTVRYRLDDGKMQTATDVGYSTNYHAITFDHFFLNTLLWGHMLTHKPNTSPQVRKAIIGVQEHLAGDVVMQFDLPDSAQVGSACGTTYKK